MTKEVFALGLNLSVENDVHAPVVRGYAVVFNRLSEDLGGFRTVIAPNALDKTLSSKADVRAFYNHDTGAILGRVSAGTLAIEKDHVGVRFALDLPNTSTGRDVYESLKRGDITGCSFGCYVRKDSWDTKLDVPVRTIQDADMFEVSLVSIPAFPDTTAALASLAKYSAENAASANAVSVDLLARMLRLDLAK